jgi:hypothetical protein
MSGPTPTLVTLDNSNAWVPEYSNIMILTSMDWGLWLASCHPLLLAQPEDHLAADGKLPPAAQMWPFRSEF